MKTKIYSLDCSYFFKQFKSLEALINYITTSGMDPNYEVTINGFGSGELASDFIIE